MLELKLIQKVAKKEPVQVIYQRSYATSAFHYLDQSATNPYMTG